MKHFGAYLWEGNANGMVKNVLNLGLKTVKALNISFILILFYMGELMLKRLFIFQICLNVSAFIFIRNFNSLLKFKQLFFKTYFKQYIYGIMISSNN